MIDPYLPILLAAIAALAFHIGFILYAIRRSPARVLATSISEAFNRYYAEEARKTADQRPREGDPA